MYVLMPGNRYINVRNRRRERDSRHRANMAMAFRNSTRRRSWRRRPSARVTGDQWLKSDPGSGGNYSPKPIA